MFREGNVFYGNWPYFETAGPESQVPKWLTAHRAQVHALWSSTSVLALTAPEEDSRKSPVTHLINEGYYSTAKLRHRLPSLARSGIHQLE
jgi:hypothetical protein